MKAKAKAIINLFFKLIMLPLAALYWLIVLVSKQQDATFAGFSQFVSLLPGKIGSFCRAGFYSWTMSYAEQDLYIGFGAIFSQADTELHKGIYVGPQSNIGKCVVGQNTLIGSGVHIMSGTKQHNFADLDTPIKDQGGHFEKISIGDDCWIGNCALIMANVGKSSIIGAGSVVTTDIPDYSIAVGNPAKVVKMRQ